MCQYKYPGFPTLTTFEASQPYSKNLADLDLGCHAEHLPPISNIKLLFELLFKYSRVFSLPVHQIVNVF